MSVHSAARFLALAALAALAIPARAQDEMPVKAELQVKLLLKVLTYDRQLEVKAGNALMIGVVSSPTSSASARATADISTELNKYLAKTVKQLKLDYRLHDYANPDKLAAWVKAWKISVIYVSPGNEKNLPAILTLSQQGKLTTMTGVPEYVRKGVAVGIGARQSRPQVLINLSSTKREGSEFDASLLRIAEIVK